MSSFVDRLGALNRFDDLVHCQCCPFSVLRLRVCSSCSSYSMVHVKEVRRSVGHLYLFRKVKKLCGSLCPPLGAPLWECRGKWNMDSDSMNQKLKHTKLDRTVACQELAIFKITKFYTLLMNTAIKKHKSRAHFLLTMSCRDFPRICSQLLGDWPRTNSKALQVNSKTHHH